MKNLLVIGCMVFSVTIFAKPREVELRTEKIKEAVHWMPEKIEVFQGEEVEFVLIHELKGGFDFHGFFVPVLKISEQVNRNKATKVVATVPADLKEGEYPIGCQFHPKHVPAILVVKKKK